MPVNISTDQQLDMVLAMRQAYQVPLPPEIALADPKSAQKYYDRMTTSLNI